MATRHVRSHSGMGDTVKFACVFCGKKLSCQPHLNHHILHHINEKGFECRFCKSTFVTLGKLKIHIAQVHNSNHSYSCVMCGKSFSTYGGLTTHIHSHTQEKPFTCSLCEKNFINNGQLQRHINTVHKKIKPYICKICGRGCLDLSALNMHVRRHIGETTLECKLCNKRFFTANELKRHEVSHHQCPHCKEKVSSATDLDNHMQIYHAGKGLKCGCPCGANFRNRYLLKSHRLSSHKGERIFKCDACPKAYLHNETLRQHKFTHLNRRDFKCVVCNKAFVYKRYLDDHMRIHTGEKPFSCSVCGRPFATQSEVKSHERIHQDVGDRYGCVFGGKYMRNQNNLYIHISCHLNGKILNRNFCDNRFLKVRSLEGHLAKGHKHVNSKLQKEKFPCIMCGKLLANNDSLTAHISHHTREKPFWCGKCGTSFSDSRSRQQHISVVHGKIRPHVYVGKGLAILVTCKSTCADIWVRNFGSVKYATKNLLAGVNSRVMKKGYIKRIRRNTKAYFVRSVF